VYVSEDEFGSELVSGLLIVRCVGLVSDDMNTNRGDRVAGLVVYINFEAADR